MEAAGHDGEAVAGHAMRVAIADLEETVGDRAFVAELIGDFLDGLPQQCATLRDADPEVVHRVAHTLRSNAATFGAVELAGACRELELAASSGLATDLGRLIAGVDEQAARATPGLERARDERAS
jgi:HPt (histidine-containing phosphotransfer) domain-containing protein